MKADMTKPPKSWQLPYPTNSEVTCYRESIETATIFPDIIKEG